MSHFVQKRMLIVAACFLLAEMSGAAGMSDNQLWSSLTVYKTISDNTVLRVGPQYKWGENCSTHYLTRYDAGAEYIAYNWARPGIGFKRILCKEQQTVEVTDVLYFDLVLKWTGTWLACDLRNRGELRSAKDSPAGVRVRQRFRMAPAHYLGATKLKPYVSGEYFYNFDAAGLAVARVYAGLFLDSGRFVHLDFYYLFQIAKDDAVWAPHNVFGTGVSFKF